MAKGLFHRAILQSGPAILPFTYNRMNGVDQAKRLAQAVDCPSSNAQYMVECMQRLDPKVYQGYGMTIDDFGFTEDTISMGPTLETFKEGDNDENVFIGEDIYEILKRGDINKVPIVIGLVAFEAYSSAYSITQKPQSLKKLKHQWGRVGKNMLILEKASEDPAQVITAVKTEFFRDRDLEKIGLMDLELLMSERHWVRPFRTMAKMYAEHTDVYMYNFTHMVPIHPDLKTNEMLKKFFPAPADPSVTRNVAMHGHELPYIFNIQGIFASFLVNIGKDHEDYSFSKNFIKAWTNFAKDGKPGKLWGSLSNEEWPKTSPDHLQILHVEDEPKIQPAPEHWAKLDNFWNSLSLKEWGGKWVSE
jgi:carboxylesterase type B